MNRKKILASILATTCLITAPANASVGTGMTDWFNSMGGFTNTTPPSSYQGQTMNGYSGGGFYLRVPQQNYQLASVTAPSLTIGCGGIDLTAGSFSFINRAALTAMLKNIGTSMGYAFLLTIKSTMPQMANLFEYLQDAAAKINSMNVNSCDMANGIVNSVGSAITDAKKNGIDHVAGSITNSVSDSFSSWNAGEQAKFAAREQEKKNDPSTKSVISPGNVVWQALSHTNLQDPDKLFIMSMTGTIIIRDADGKGAAGHWDYIQPTGLTANDFIGYKNIANQQLSLFSCDTPTDCLNPTVAPVAATTFLEMVSKSIDSLKNNVSGRTQQNLNDFYLVGSSKLPVWKMISVSADVHPDLVDNYKRLIAVDVAYSYIQGILTTAHETLSHGQLGTLAPDATAALEKLGIGIDKFKAELYTQRLVEYAAVQKQAEVERELQLLNQTMLAGIPAQAFNSMSVFGGTP